MHNRWSRRLAAAALSGASLAALVLPLSPAVAQTAERKQFNIPAQDAARALEQFGRQSGRSVMFDPARLTGARSRAVQGQLTPQEALDRLLTGTGFSARQVNANTFVVSPRSGETPIERSSTADDDGYRANEIVVTAQKRVESAQDVPIAITALSQKNLEEQKIEGGPDIMRAVPNLTFSKSNFTGYNVSIRGIGTKAISATTDPGVAVAFNNSGLIQNRFFEQEFFDMERLEVLRGPQGTLYGRNATGGVINLISAKPKLNKFEGSIKGEVGNYDSKRMSAMLNVPIIDDIFGVRVAGSMTQRDGYDYNSITRNRVNGRDLYSFRATAAFEPAPWFRANAIWERFHENDNRSRTGKQLCHRDPGPETIGNTQVAQAPDSGQFANTPFNTLLRPALFSQGCKPGSLYDDDAFGTPNGLALPFVFGILANSNGTTKLGNLPDDPPGTPRSVITLEDPYGGMMQSRNLREIASIRDPRYRAKADVFELNVDIDVSDALTLTSQTVYNTDSTYSFQDYNRFNTLPTFVDTSQLLGTAVGGNRPPSDWKDLAPNGVFCDPQIGCSDRVAGFDISQAYGKQFGQELRLQSHSDGPLNFSFGANYTHFKTQVDYYVMYNLLTAIAQMDPFSHPINGVVDPTMCSSSGALAGLFAGATTNLGAVPAGDPAANCPYIDPNPVESINGDGHNYFRSSNPYRLRSYAAFGELYWNVADAVKLTAGLRYTDDRKTFVPVPSQLLLAPGIFSGGTVSRGYPEGDPIRQHWGEWTGRLGVDWKTRLAFTDETLLYAFFSRGYKGGGFNPPSPGFATAEQFTAQAEAQGYPQATIDLLNSTGTFLPVLRLNAVEYGSTFKPEFVNAFEIGAKNTLLNGALTLNATAFYYDYKDYQVSQIRDRTAVNENFDAKVWGAELEARFAPTRNLRLNANIGWLKTRIGKGETSIDIMNRTQGDPNYTLLKPWVQLPSNCVVPTAVAESWLQSTATGAPLANYRNICGGLGGTLGPGFAGALVLPKDPNFGNSPYDFNNYPELNGGAGLKADLGGNELPNSPHWTVNLGAEYTIPFAQDWSATIRGDGYWQGKSWARVYNLDPYDRLKSWTNFNLSLRVDGPDDLSIEAYVKNVFNKAPITDAFLNSDDSGLTTNVFTLDPRIIGFSIAKKF